MKKAYICIDCGQITTYHKPGYKCGYCGASPDKVIEKEKAK